MTENLFHSGRAIRQFIGVPLTEGYNGDLISGQNAQIAYKSAEE